MFDFMMDDNEEASYQTSGPIVPEAMDCMRCGMCLSYCPTYKLTNDEQEGPRQRIRTLSKLVVDKEAIDAEALDHLQNCTQCRACEAVCPSKMDYGLLYDQAQHKLAEHKTPSFHAKAGLWFIKNKTVFNSIIPFANIYINSKLQDLSRKSGMVKKLGLERADQLATIKPQLTKLKSEYVKTDHRGTVALFTGCISERFDRQTLDSTITVLNTIGYRVIVPRQQNCCGALHWHNGQQDEAIAMMTNNVSQFNAQDVDAIIYSASGCGSHLSEYKTLLQDSEQLNEFDQKITEISDFIVQHWPDFLKIEASDKRILVHEPCSHRNVLKSQSSIYQLLDKIPGLVVDELVDNQLCCGAGGSYMLSHPDNADALRDLKWQHINEVKPDYLVTSNIGCALHLATGNKSSEVLVIIHPITLLAQQLKRD